MTRQCSWKKASPIPLAVLLALGSVGCSAMDDSVIEKARYDYEVAATSPTVNKLAPVELRESKKALDAAERAWQDKDLPEVEHQAYIVDRRVRIAREQARLKQAQIEMKALGERRNAVVLSAREDEISAKQREIARKERDLREKELLIAEKEKTIADQARELADLKAKRTERGLVITLGDVLFEVDRADLKAGTRQNLGRLVEFLREHEDREVLIEGHTDSTGEEAYNQRLSESRAQAVRQFLTRNGIANKRVLTRGYGELFPVASNNNATGRQQNRRVEVVIIDEGKRAEDVLRNAG